MSAAQELSETRDKIVNLLNHHVVSLVERDYVFVCLMQSELDGRVQVTGFERQALPSLGRIGPAGDSP